jgi:hypothetical protein
MQDSPRSDPPKFIGSAGAAVVSSFISGFFGSRSQRRSDQQQARTNIQMNRERNATEMWLAETRRMWDLQDRRYKEEAFGSFRQFNRDPGLSSPEFTTPTPPTTAKPPTSGYKAVTAAGGNPGGRMGAPGAPSLGKMTNDQWRKIV